MSNIKYRSHLVLLIITITILYLIQGENRAIAQEADEHRANSMATTEDIIKYLKKPLTRSLNPFELQLPFAFESYELNYDAIKQLDALGKALQSPELEGISIKLAGHTDERGSEEFNQRLSEKRVEAAKEYLVDKYAIEQNRIYTEGFGETMPIIPNSKNEPEHALNRRVELKKMGRITGTHNDKSIETKTSGYSRVDWEIFHIDQTGKINSLRKDITHVMHNQERFKIYLNTHKQYHVYAYRYNENGKGGWLFPQKGAFDVNPLDQGDIWLPARNNSYELDGIKGNETIFLIASSKPIKEFEDNLKMNSTVGNFMQVITDSDGTRGIEKTYSPNVDEKRVQTVSIESQGNNLTTQKEFSKTETVPAICDIKNMVDFYAEFNFLHQ